MALSETAHAELHPKPWYWARRAA